MPRHFEPAGSSEDAGFLPVFLLLGEVEKQQHKKQFHEGWDRLLPSGETTHRFVVEPLATAYGALERVAKSHKVATVLGAGALSATLGFVSSSVLKR